MKSRLIISVTVLALLGGRSGRRLEAAEEEISAAEETMRLGLIEDANAAHAEGDHAKAFASAQKALKLKRTPSLQLFISREAVETGDFAIAYDQSRLCVAAAERDKGLRNRSKIIKGCQDVREAVKDRIGYIVVQLAEPPTGLQIKISGEEISAAALGNPYVVNPGTIIVQATAPAFGSFRAEITVSVGEKKEISVALAPAQLDQPPPTENAGVYPTLAPPEPIPEDRPAAPGPAYSWTSGYWDWSGSDWSWRSGVWAPYRDGFAYVEPRYVWVDSRPVYFRGYWQGPNGTRDDGDGSRAQPPAALVGRPRVAPQIWRAQPAHNNWRGNGQAPAPNTRANVPVAAPVLWRGSPPAVPVQQGVWHPKPGMAPLPSGTPAAPARPLTGGPAGDSSQSSARYPGSAAPPLQHGPAGDSSQSSARYPGSAAPPLQHGPAGASSQSSARYPGSAAPPLQHGPAGASSQSSARYPGSAAPPLQRPGIARPSPPPQMPNQVVGGRPYGGGAPAPPVGARPVGRLNNLGIPGAVRPAPVVRPVTVPARTAPVPVRTAPIPVRTAPIRSLPIRPDPRAKKPQ
jgi:hypothetical protein